MRTLTPPNFSVREILGALGNGRRIDRVHEVADEICDGELEYLAHADSATLSDLTPNHSGIDNDAGEDIRYAYDAKLVDKNGPARAFYNALRTAPHNRCPVCLERDIGALDHFLPKERWPRLAIVPANLVPICTACNGTKSSGWSADLDEQYLHPYYDDLGTRAWVGATLLRVPGAPLVFKVIASADWDDVMCSRVTLHFERFALAELFANHASTLLASYDGQLQSIHALGGASAVRELLLGTASSFRGAAIDLWSSLAMQTWGESDWFCDGGWRT
ncbi:hypothetical protein [Cryobacterium sp. Hb1]|uniref:hypothetical protein n=1 Tax=Cryobacterium sp. Hb1 TaxID=1259147 RepID=UPI00106A72EE|nr:hypothetical protein [Cryobacterium sp. Hb1]TFD63758.1 hypothetical protein E3T38_16430 [Cryobacterium sp. Hb1]